MTNILGDAKKHQVIALGQLGWTLRRIEQACRSRRWGRYEAVLGRRPSEQAEEGGVTGYVHN
jgi:hypothetical protein